MSLNLALFASAYAPHRGGVEEVCRQLARHLTAAGDRVVVVTNRWPRSLPKTETIEGVTVHRLAMREPVPQIKGRVNYHLTHRLEQRRLAAILRRHATRLLAVHCLSSNAAYALDARRRLGLPLVATTHGELTMDAAGRFARSGYAADLFRDTLRAADAVTACSRHTLDEALAFVGDELAAPSSVIHNGIDPAEFDDAEPYEHARPYVLALGRHVRAKGFDVLLEAYRLWLKKTPDAPDLLLAGDGDQHEALRAQRDASGLRGRVHLPGATDRRRTVSLFAGCEFFVLPSRHEPFGIVNLEAMAAGKAVIATNVGGVPEVVADGETGVLVDAEAPAPLAATMDRLHRSPPSRHGLAVAGKRFASQRDWAVLARRYRGIYSRFSKRPQRTAAAGPAPAVHPAG
ncbi:MAG: glycosyltransferase family 4 protein [Planctomycetota bacterium]